MFGTKYLVHKQEQRARSVLSSLVVLLNTTGGEGEERKEPLSRNTDKERPSALAPLPPPDLTGVPVGGPSAAPVWKEQVQQSRRPAPHRHFRERPTGRAHLVPWDPPLCWPAPRFQPGFQSAAPVLPLTPQPVQLQQLCCLRGRREPRRG